MRIRSWNCREFSLLVMNKIAGIGIDIEEPVRFINHLPTGSEISGLIKDAFTEDEIEHNRLNHPHLTFPLGFSCKEAFFKAFGISWTNSPISWHDIEIIFGNPANLYDYSIRLGGYARELFDKMQCKRFESSFEINGSSVVFMVFLIAD